MEDLWAFELGQMTKIMEHRSISLRDIANEVGCSERWIRLVFKGDVSQSSMESWVNRIDVAVTSITDQRGGIPFACCSLGAYGAMVREIERGSLA